MKVCEYCISFVFVLVGLPFYNTHLAAFSMIKSISNNCAHTFQKVLPSDPSGASKETNIFFFEQIPGMFSV